MKLRLGAAAMNQTPLDWENNLNNIRTVLAKAREDSVQILCLQELSITSYGCQDMFFAHWVAEKAGKYVLELLSETKGLTVCFGIPLWHEDELYNCMVFVSDGVILGISAKQNLPGDGVYYEPRWFTPWTAGRKIEIDFFGHTVPFGDILYDIHGIKIGFEICEDAWRTKRPACNYIDEGVDLILNPSASHYEFGKVRIREQLMLNSSKEFNCTYLFANQLGNEAGRLIYEGDLLIASKGSLLSKGEHLKFKSQHVIWRDVDFSSANSAVDDIPDSGKMEEFTQAAALALFDYLRKSASRGYTISLSGGADSSVCAVLVREMVRRGIDELGKENFGTKLGRKEWGNLKEQEIVKELLCCVYQGTKNSSDITRNAASSVAIELGADYLEWDIDEEITLATDKIQKAIHRDLNWKTDDLTLQNIQARMRSPLVWMLANTRNHLLITTANRSEGDVGYTTMDGDSSGGLAPLADLDKVFVREWMKWAKEELGYKSLDLVIRQQPTAELRPLNTGQTDEEDLMPYELLLEIEKLAIKEKYSPLQVFDILKENKWEAEILKLSIAKFYKSWAISQWKRERMAPSFHFDHFNIDPKTWLRFPILNGSFAEEIRELTKNS